MSDEPHEGGYSWRRIEPFHPSWHWRPEYTRYKGCGQLPPSHRLHWLWFAWDRIDYSIGRCDSLIETVETSVRVVGFRNLFLVAKAAWQARR